MNWNSMKSQIFVAIGASVLVTGLASIIYAQSNMTGGNMTGGNMTGGNMSMPTGDGSRGDGDDGGNGDGGDDENDGQSGEDAEIALQQLI